MFLCFRFDDLSYVCVLARVSDDILDLQLRVNCIDYAYCMLMDDIYDLFIYLFYSWH